MIGQLIGGPYDFYAPFDNYHSAMPHTWRLFIVTSQSFRRHPSRTGVRNFTSVRSLHQQHETFSIPPTTRLSSGTSVSEIPSGAADGESKRSDVAKITDAIAEISLESIDAIAAESKSQDELQYRVMDWDQTVPVAEKKPEKEKRSDKPKEIPRTAFRGTKLEDTSFALHFSATRAPQKEPLALGRVSGSISRTNTILATRQEEDQEEGHNWEPPPREHWQIDKAALKYKFPHGWNPKKRLSPDALAGIRALHAQMPEVYTTAALAENFKVSSEAIRRILKSNWSPSADEESDRQRRWFERGKKIYAEFAEKGGKPPKPWRDLGIGDGKPDWLLRKQAARDRPRAPLPALITTARKLEQRRREREEAESSSLSDRIL